MILTLLGSLCLFFFFFCVRRLPSSPLLEGIQQSLFFGLLSPQFVLLVGTASPAQCLTDFFLASRSSAVLQEGILLSLSEFSTGSRDALPHRSAFDSCSLCLLPLIRGALTQIDALLCGCGSTFRYRACSPCQASFCFNFGR